MKQQTASRIKKISRAYRPEGMSLEEWQVALRREYGGARRSLVRNKGNAPGLAFSKRFEGVRVRRRLGSGGTSYLSSFGQNPNSRVVPCNQVVDGMGPRDGELSVVPMGTMYGPSIKCANTHERRGEHL